MAKFSSLVLRDLTKSFDGVRALGTKQGEHSRDARIGFSYRFRRGRIYGVIGLNGAGKTTLFNCIRGLITPDSGEVWLGENLIFGPRYLMGQKQQGWRRIVATILDSVRSVIGGSKFFELPPHKVGNLVGTSFQTCSNQENMPAWKNVFLAFLPIRGPWDVLKEFFLSLIPIQRHADIITKEAATQFLTEMLRFPTDRLESSVGDLSFIDRRKVELAKAFAPGKGVVLLDEPTAGLNDSEKLEFVDLIRTLSKDRIVVVIEHNHKVLARLAHEVIYMADGNIGLGNDGKEIVGTYASVMDNEKVKEDYVGGLLSAKYTKQPHRPREPILRVNIMRAAYSQGGAILRDITLTVEKANIIGIVGLNGAGKTTLLRCLINSDELPHLNANVELWKDGMLIKLVDQPRRRSMSTPRIARKGVFLVPQEDKLFETMSVDENLRFGALCRNQHNQLQVDAAVDWFYETIFARAFAGSNQNDSDFLRTVGSRRASELSGGQKQLLAIGRAMIAGGLFPSTHNKGAGEDILLLLDEPTSGLQPSLAALVLDTVQSLRTQLGLASIITEQVADLARIVDVVYRLEGGKLTAA